MKYEIGDLVGDYYITEVHYENGIASYDLVSKGGFLIEKWNPFTNETIGELYHPVIKNISL